MGIFANILVGLPVIAAGIALVVKSEWVFQNFGASAWAEEKLGSSRLFYKLIGAFMAFVGVLILTGLWKGIVIGTLGAIFAPGQR